MNNFARIAEALRYIDNHLEESLNLEALAEKFSFSQFYFHRLFSAIVGKPLASYIRERRILYACNLLYSTEMTILDVSLIYGFNSPQSFIRAFKEIHGLLPSEYRKNKCKPDILTVDELIMRFTNRLRGGIYLKPNIIKKEAMLIAGTYGDADKTWEVWNSFEKLISEHPIKNCLSKNGYEIRICDENRSVVYVGYPILNRSDVDSAYSVFELPSSKYASFDVYVANGYMSENNAMQEWLKTNDEGYTERLLNNESHYCVEYYDERFNGSEADSIVEIWVPIQKN